MDLQTIFQNTGTITTSTTSTTQTSGLDEMTTFLGMLAESVTGRDLGVSTGTISNSSTSGVQSVGNKIYYSDVIGEYSIEYAEESTKEIPILLVKGVDCYGREFEETVAIHSVDPRESTYIELQCLGFYMDTMEDEYHAMPWEYYYTTPTMDDTYSYENIFQSAISTEMSGGNISEASLWSSRLTVYEKFLEMYQDSFENLLLF